MKVIAIDLGATSGRVMTITHENHHFSYQENSRFLNRTYTDENGYLRWDFPYSFLLKNEHLKNASIFEDVLLIWQSVIFDESRSV